MRRDTTTIGLLLATALLLGSVSASTVPTLNWGEETDSAECDSEAAPVINVKRRVVNSMDSGFGDDVWWAYDDYTQQIQIWETAPGEFCFVQRFQGHFDGVAGFDSPEGDDTLTGEESGPFEGGIQGTFEATMKEDPDWRTRGFVGTQDYRCDIHASRGNGAVCPGAVSWMAQYFEDVSEFGLGWWGFIYHGGNCGTWENSVDEPGNGAGDIVCPQRGR